MTDTIAAIATPAVPSAIGILRLSGPRAAEIAGAVFRTKGGRALAEYGERRLVYGTLLDGDGAPIDQVLATYSRGPASYTGEDTAELQCHGSPVVLAMGLEALLRAGARQALPGEFTKRAFLNGRLDLTQAEAVADLIDAETPAAVRQAAGQLSGALGRRVQGIYDGLVDVAAHFHAVLDYPDEDIGPFQAQTLSRALAEAAGELSALLETCERGKFIAHGVPCAIIGRPNAGKSSLLNALAGYERAIVTPIPGTTRDTVEARCTLGGVSLRLIDTAGLRETEDPVEALGVARSRAALGEAALILAVVDGADLPAEEDREVLLLAASSGKPWIYVESKRDLSGIGACSIGVFGGEGTPPAAAVPVSSVTGEGLDELAAAVAALFPAIGAEGAGELLSNARQADAARRALEGVRRASGSLSGGMTPDAVLLDVEEAMLALGELTGKTVREDVTDRIFQRFCVGK